MTTSVASVVSIDSGQCTSKGASEIDC
jgi:hypothetical protein